jgi:hypothetical protein
MRDDVTELISFDESAWGVVLAYVLFVLLVVRLACFESFACFVVLLVLDLTWFSATLYTVLRTWLHLTILATPMVKGQKAFRLWPAKWLDRLMFPFHW